MDAEDDEEGPLRKKRSAPTPCPACGTMCKGLHGLKTHRGMTGCSEKERRQVVQQTANVGAETAERRAYEKTTKEFLVTEIGIQRYNNNVPASHLDQMRDSIIRPLTMRMRDELLRRTTCPVSQEELAQTICDVLDPYKGIETRAKEDTVRGEQLHVMKVKPRFLLDREGKETKDCVYDVPLDQRLEMWLQQQPATLAQCRAAQDAWKSAEEDPTVLGDLTDGEFCRCHPVVGIEARKERGKVEDIYCTAILYYDECESVGALGAFTGVHKMGLFYWVLGELNPETRMASHNIQLASIVLDPDMKQYGPKQIICGPEGEEHGKGTSIGAGFERLHDGVSMYLPEVSGKEWKDVQVHMHLICFAADYPAAALCGGFKASTSAHCYCRQCLVEKEKASRPNTFLGALRKKLGALLSPSHANRAKIAPSEFKLRTQEGHESDAKKCAMLSGVPKEDFLIQHGVRTYDVPTGRIPLFDPTVCFPQDTMHTLPEGVLKMHIAALMFHMVRRAKWCSIQDINDRVHAYATPEGMGRFPAFNSVILDGKGKRPKADPWPKKGIHVHGTAAQILHLTQHSAQIFGPLVVDKKDAVWLNWLELTRITALIMQHTLTIVQVATLDAMIQEYLAHFNKIPWLQQLFKPKQHFLTHIPRDILLFGPPRLYWCMRFEAFNQVFKKIAVSGNFHNTLKRCTEFWLMRSAMNMHLNRVNTWGRTQPGGLGMQQIAQKDVHLLPVVEAFVHQSLFAEAPFSFAWADTMYHLGHVYTPHMWVVLTMWDAIKPMVGYVHRIVHSQDPTLVSDESDMLVLQMLPPSLMCLDSSSLPYAQLPAGFLHSTPNPADLLLLPVSLAAIYPMWSVRSTTDGKTYFVPTF